MMSSSSSSYQKLKKLPTQEERSTTSRWQRLRSGRRRLRKGIRVPSLRRLLKRKVRVFKLAVRKVIKRIKEGKPHLGEIFAGNYLFMTSAEGIFRINPENSEEKDLRNQLNKGIIPDDIDVHCLAGLIKAWFRELPEGVLDSLSPAQVLECEDEDDCVALVKLLPPMESALVHWVVDLMADVVEEEDANKMNARNIAMVFAPNMTQLSDPLTSLMHAVQVMNLLQTLIFKTLREREEFSFSPSLDLEDDYDSQARSSVVECEIVEEIQECFFRHLELEEAENQETTRSSDVSVVTSERDTSSSTTDFVSDSVAVVCEDEEEPIETVEDCNEMEMAVDANISSESRISNDDDA